MTAFSVLAGRVHREGEPHPGGGILRESGHTSTIACGTCGPLPADAAAEWSPLCHDAMKHVNETGHLVVVDSWRGAIYGPRT